MLAKHELLKVPLIGWTWYFLEIVFCKRRWEEDKKTVFSGLNRLKDYPEFMWVGTKSSLKLDHLQSAVYTQQFVQLFVPTLLFPQFVSFAFLIFIYFYLFVCMDLFACIWR